MEQLWFVEMQRFSALVKELQVQWLAKLLFLLTIFARESYALEGKSMGASEELRRYNEVMHRVSAHLLKVVQGDEQRMPDDILFEMLAQELSFLGVDVNYLMERMK